MYTFLGNICTHLPFLLWRQSNFAKFIENHQFQSLVFIKLHEKETSAQLISCEFCETFKDIFL